VRHGVASGEGRGQGLRVVEAERREGRPGELARGHVAPIEAPGQQHQFMPLRRERPRQMAADEAGGPRDRDFHDDPSCIVLIFRKGTKDPTVM